MPTQWAAAPPFNPHHVLSPTLCPSACAGGTNITPLATYWHSSPNSTQIHKCPNPSACGYGGQCLPGYQGNLCGDCTTGFGQRKPFECGQCAPAVASWATMLTAMLLLLGLIVYAWRATWADNQSADTERGQQGMLLSDVFKVLVLHVQYLVVIGSLQLPWPAAMNALLTAAAYVFAASNSQVISLDCIIPASSLGTGSIPLAIRKQLVYLVVPLLMLAAVVLLQALAWLLNRLLAKLTGVSSESSASTANDGMPPNPFKDASDAHAAPSVSFREAVLAKLPVICIVTLFFFYPILVRVGWSMFACITVDRLNTGAYPEYSAATARYGFWVLDMQQQCWAGQHLTYTLALGIPCFLIFCLAMPTGLWLWLRSNRQRLADPVFRQYAGSLYRNYNDSRYAWEVLMMMQTALLVGASVFAHVLGMYHTTLLLSVIFMVFLVLQVAFKPYAFPTLHHLQLAVMISLYGTTIVALSMVSVEYSVNSVYANVAAVVALVANAAAICWALLWVYRLVFAGRMVQVVISRVKTGVSRLGSSNVSSDINRRTDVSVLVPDDSVQQTVK